MSELDEVMREFLIECHENLDQLDRDLVILEQDPRHRDVLANIFRTIHTIKGTSGFFDFHTLGAITHSGENLLSKLRDGALLVTPDITGGLLALVDAVRALLARIESSGKEGDADYSALVARLDRLQVPPTRTVAPPTPEPAEVAAQDVVGGITETNIRVDVGLLDRLMNLVGELVLTRNQILQHASGHKDPVFLGTSQRLNLITTELQEGVMKTRMQPISTIWSKFPRVVRDLAVTCGKQVRLTLEGKETELDKSIIEAVKDPLTHLVRNAIDHGIECPADRVARGKPAEGHLCLRAFHEGGQVNIEVTDDGGGIDPIRVRDKAIERGLVSREQAARMTERELLQLIFLPGFSTAATVTSVSGRGVGMDVVKTNVERISGSIDLQSRPGRGATVRIKIPLTLAIIPALLVHSGGDCYAIPQISLLELVRLEREQARRSIESLHGAPVYRLRGRLLPIVYFNRELCVADAPEAKDADAVNIVVLQADGRPFGLVVDGVSDTEEIVVKPMCKQLKGVPIYAGATILGDGRVALILDVLGLAQHAGVVAEIRDRNVPTVAPAPEAASRLQSTLLVGLSGDRQMGIPLSQVDRLEEVPHQAVERSGGREVTQYRGAILPLLRLTALLGDGGPLCPVEPQGSLQVVVCAAAGRRVGLVVDRILDVVDAAADSSGPGGHGLVGTAIIQDRVTDLLDVSALVGGAYA
jgi:two-component system, chemotaxis family, sensor kinase CheA